MSYCKRFSRRCLYQSLVGMHTPQLNLLVSSSRYSGNVAKRKENITINVSIPRDGIDMKISGKIGTKLADAVRADEEVSRYLECVCGGICACSTCHVYVDPAFSSRLKDPEEHEQDMLDLAWGYGETSRLACQIELTDDIDGIKVTIPDEANDLHG